MKLNSREEVHNIDETINIDNNINKSIPTHKRKLKRNNNHSRFKNIILLILIIIIFLIVIPLVCIYFIPKKQASKIKDKRINCTTGYYFPVDDNSSNKQCLKCSVENCQNCSGNLNSNTITSCLSSLIPKYDNYNKISSCELPEEDFSETENEKNRENEKEYINEDDVYEEEIINEIETNVYEEEKDFHINSDFLTSYVINDEKSILIETDINREIIPEVNYTIKAEYFSSESDEYPYTQLINSSYIDKVIDMKIDNYTINLLNFN